MSGEVYNEGTGANYVEDEKTESVQHPIRRTGTGQNSIKNRQSVAGLGFPYTLPFTLA